MNLNLKITLPKFSEEYYVIECREGEVRALFFEASGNELRFLKYFPAVSFEDVIPFIHGLNFLPRAKGLFVYERTLAATFGGSVRFERGDGLQPVTEADFDKFLTQATNQFFNRFREEAKRLFGSDDVNTVLANNRFLGLRLDGKKVVNPVGLRGKAAELELEQTFLTRQVMSVLHDASHTLTSMFHIERATGYADLVESLYPDTRVMYAIVSPLGTRVYATGIKQRYFGAVSFPKVQERGHFDWGAEYAYRAIESEFGFGAREAHALLTRYAEGDCSKHFSRFLESVLEKETTRFASELARLVKKDERIVVFSESPFLKEEGTLGGLAYSAPSFSKLRAHLGISIIAPHDFPHEAFSPAFLAGFVAYLNRTGDNYLYALGKERMRWLTPVNSV